MKLLITPALRLTENQKEILAKDNELVFTESENRIDLKSAGFDAAEIEGVICNSFFHNNPLAAFPGLKYIQSTGVGTDRMPMNEICERGIEFHGIGDAYAVPMAEWAVCKTLEIYKHSRDFYRKQAEAIWEKDRQLEELDNKKAAIVGYGNVGRNIAKRLKGFDTYIIAVSRRQINDPQVDSYYEFDRIDEALEEADIVYLTLPLTENTYHLIDETRINKMKDDSIMINLSRGAIVDEAALIAALGSGKFLGVALDVFEKEPLEKESPLWTEDRVLITPHNSFVGSLNSERIFERVMSNLSDYSANREE